MFTAASNRYDTMVYRFAGSTGLKLPALSLGLWHNFGHTNTMQQMESLLLTAFDHGITHFDLADNYGPDPGCAEENFGRILHRNLMRYRDEMLISTKAGCEMWAGPYGQMGSRKHLLAGLDQSLRRMNLDYVDIFYLHCMDVDTPLEESMLALDQAVRSGKALYVGLSNHNGERARHATAILKEMRTPFVLHQNSFSLLNHKNELNGLKQFAQENNQGIIAFKPLEQGMLTDKYLQGIPEDSRIARDGRYLRESSLTEAKMDQIRQLNHLAHERGESLARMALAWLYHDSAITSILIGASKPEQILDNLGVLSSSGFSEEERTKIEKITS